MAAQPTQSDDLIPLTLDAVRALLREIANGTHSSVGGSNSSVLGTYASFAAQALRDLMGCAPLSGIVHDAIENENLARRSAG